MGTLSQLLALPACFLLLGLLRGDCRHLLTALLRRLSVMTGAHDAARVELMKRFSPGAACGFMDSVQRRAAIAREDGRRKNAGPASGGESRSAGRRDAVVAGSAATATWRRAAARPAAPQLAFAAGPAARGRRFALHSVIGSP